MAVSFSRPNYPPLPDPLSVVLAKKKTQNDGGFYFIKTRISALRGAYFLTELNEKETKMSLYIPFFVYADDFLTDVLSNLPSTTAGGAVGQFKSTGVSSTCTHRLSKEVAKPV